MSLKSHRMGFSLIYFKPQCSLEVLFNKNILQMHSYHVFQYVMLFTSTIGLVGVAGVGNIVLFLKQ